MIEYTDITSISQSNFTRAAFVAQGTSLRAWCLANGVRPQNAHKALNGTWVGPKATALVEKINRAANGS